MASNYTYTGRACVCRARRLKGERGNKSLSAYSHFPLDELHQHAEETAKLNFVLPSAPPTTLPSLCATPQAPSSQPAAGGKKKAIV